MAVTAIRTTSRFARAGVRRVLNGVNRFIGPVVERLLAARGKLPEPRPILIIGAPRSGSTLLMQTIVASLDVGYLSNRHCRIFGAPVLAERARSLEPIDFTSYYGLTNAPHGPSECASWWYRFFRREPAYVSEGEMEAHAIAALRRSLALIQRAADRHVVLKNLYAALRLAPLAEAVPGALYIHLMRDPVENARSILRARKDVTGDYRAWWSVPVPGQSTLARQGAVAQVLGQIEGIDALIARDAARFDLPVLQMDYGSFCDDPAGSLENIVCFAAKEGVEISWRAAPPKPFVRRGAKLLSDEIEDELAEQIGGRVMP